MKLPWLTKELLDQTLAERNAWRHNPIENDLLKAKSNKELVVVAKKAWNSGVASKQNSFTAFWKDWVSRNLKGFTKEESKCIIQIVKEECKIRQRFHRRRHDKEAFGISCRGKVDRVIKLQKGLDRVQERLNFVPEFKVSQKVSVELQERLKRVQTQILSNKHFGRTGHYKDARDSNKGKSLGMTLVSGGRCADKSKGFSGSLHNSKHFEVSRLWPKTESGQKSFLEDARELHSLKQELHDVLATIIISQFGKTR